MRCKESGISFEITDADRAFYQRMGVPEPRLCPEERRRRRLVFRNERNLYRRACDATGKMIVTIHDEDAPFPVVRFLGRTELRAGNRFFSSIL